MSLHLSYEDCYNIAKKYTIKKDFRLGEPAVYNYAVRNNWLQDYTWLKRASKIEKLYKECYQEAQKYTNVIDFQKQNDKQYQIALKYRWFKQFDWLKDTSRYDYYYQRAQKFTSLKEFRIKDRSAYVTAAQNDWIKDYTWLERKYKKTDYNWSIKEYSIKYTYENCLNIAKQYKTKQEFKDNDLICYNKSQREGWFKDYTWLKNRHRAPYDQLTYSECFEMAKQCQNRTEMQKKFWSAFRKATLENWFPDYKWFTHYNVLDGHNYCVYAYEDDDNKTVYIGLTKDMERRHRQHRNKIPGKDIFDNVKTYFLDQNKELPSYKILINNLTVEEAQSHKEAWLNTYKENGWNLLNKFTAKKKLNYVGRHTHKWTKETCLEMAKKYQTLKDFMLYDNGAYQACCRNGWIKEITWTRRNKTFSTKPIPIVEVDVEGNIINRFESKTEAMKQCGLTLHTMRNALEMNEKLKNGNFLRKACTFKKI